MAADNTNNHNSLYLAMQQYGSDQSPANKISHFISLLHSALLEAQEKMKKEFPPHLEYKMYSFSREDVIVWIKKQRPFLRELKDRDWQIHLTATKSGDGYYVDLNDIGDGFLEESLYVIGSLKQFQPFIQGQSDSGLTLKISFPNIE